MNKLNKIIPSASRMHPALVTVLSLLFTSPLFGQTRSYEQEDLIKISGVTTSVQADALNQAEKQSARVYFDGLGRPVQSVGLQASPNGKDIIKPVAYDASGMQTINYLPYAAMSDNAAYQSSAIPAQAAFYQVTTDKVADNTAPYSERVFENSPLSRLLKEGMTGAGFQPSGSGTQHYKTVSYRSSATADYVLVWSSTGTTSPTYYSANSLSVVDATDEQGIRTMVFTDMHGRTVLKRQVNTSAYLDTYYVYNAAGLVSYVIPPKATKLMIDGSNYSLSQSGVNKLIFKYGYDVQGRMVEKTVPSAEVAYIIYDPLSRPVLLQDANMRVGNKWNYIKYDQWGRAISQGIYTDATRTNRTDMQTYVSGLSGYNSTWGEERNSTSGTGYYTNSVFPTSGIEPLAYSYYDDYDLDGNGSADYSYQSQSLTGEGTATDKTRGLPTMLRKRTVGAGFADIWLINITFYDGKLRPIQTRSNNQLNSTVADVSTKVLDFTGKALITKVAKATSATTTVKTAFSYDSMDRLTALDQTYNAGTATRIAGYEYNEIGQLVKRNLHDLSGGAGIATDITLGTAESVAASTTKSVTATNSITITPDFSTGLNAEFSATVTGTPWLQAVDYRYNIRGQLLSINNSTLTSDGVKNDDTNDVFGMELSYDEAVSGLGNTASFNGQLTAARWMSVNASGAKSVERSNKYTYDQLNRIAASSYQDKVSGSWNSSGAYDEKDILYDVNGNITALKRNALIGSTVTAVDNLTYTYDSANPNRLKNMADGSGSNYTSYGFRNLTASTADYVYDDNGNITTDPYKGLTEEYNVLNRVQKITVTTASGRYINYTYDAMGVLIRKQQYNSSTLQKTTDYVDGFVYEDNGLAYFAMPEGRVRNVGGTLKAEYVITDNQGNARVSFENNSGTAKVVQENSYYAFGLIMPNSPVSTPTSPNRNLYNGGSEWQNDYADLPDYYQTFYRNYDAALGRWTGVDPMAEMAESLTGYNYSDNNPAMFNDPMGDMTLAQLQRNLIFLLGTDHGGRFRGDNPNQLFAYDSEEAAKRFSDPGNWYRYWSQTVNSYTNSEGIQEFEVKATPHKANQGGGGATVYVETDGMFGHTYIEVNNAVFSFGRYAGGSSPPLGIMDPVGPGVLQKGTHQLAVDKMKKSPTLIYQFPLADANKIFGYLNGIYNSGTPNTGKNGGMVTGMTYTLLGPNCTTLVIGALQVGGVNIPNLVSPSQFREWEGNQNLFMPAH
ncbi:DUF6443 domain-containing protein [Mucilaginibacter sp. HD30]